MAIVFWGAVSGKRCSRSAINLRMSGTRAEFVQGGRGFMEGLPPLETALGAEHFLAGNQPTLAEWACFRGLRWR